MTDQQIDDIPADERTPEGQDMLARIGRIAPFDRIDPATLQAAVARAEIQPLQKGEVLLEPGMGPPNSFYVLLSGRVEGLANGSDGQPVWSLGRGDSFPLGALMERRPVGTRQVVAEAGEAVVLPREAFEALRQRSDEFNDFCTRRIGHLLSRPAAMAGQAQAGELGGQGALLDPTTPIRARLDAAPLILSGHTPRPRRPVSWSRAAGRQSWFASARSGA